MSESERKSEQPLPRFEEEIQSVDEILNRLKLKKSDLNNLGPDTIQSIFEDLTVGEISRLCSISRTFNNICKKESLWKYKVLRDYEINRKTRRTWRETARKAYLESLERYWYDTLEHDLNYYFIEPNQTESPQIMFDNPTNYDFASMQYEKDFVERALKDRKAIQATKLIFNAFHLSSRYILDNKRFYLNFMPLFRRAAEVSPGGKIPLQWILDALLNKDKIKIREFDPDAWAIAIADKHIEPPVIPLTLQDYSDRYRNGYIMNEYQIVGCPGTGMSEREIREFGCGNLRWSKDDYHKYLSENRFTKQKQYWLNSLEAYILPWNEANEDLYNDMAPLAELYKQHPELFIDDTKDGDDADMGMVLINYPGPIL
uniref:F-box-like family protein n=1 Tax=Pithovirus LCPAC406 TaxID=2506599 RepID=A0A481ZE67_9VIRU|nr:MAG: F-box-like family protein [Pithovirus LCPAC406]